MPQREERLQQEIIERYDRISNLYVAYINSGKFSDVFGREFFHAVGDILQGVSNKNLMLYHLAGTPLTDIVDHTLSKGGTPGTKTETRKHTTRSSAAQRKKAHAGARDFVTRVRARDLRNNS